MAPVRKRLTTVPIELPGELVTLLGRSTAESARCLTELALIDLYRRGEVAGGYAAGILGINRWDFIQLLGKHQVPYVDMTEEELNQEIEAARSFLKPLNNGSSQTPAR